MVVCDVWRHWGISGVGKLDIRIAPFFLGVANAIIVAGDGPAWQLLQLFAFCSPSLKKIMWSSLHLGNNTGN